VWSGGVIWAWTNVHKYGKFFSTDQKKFLFTGGAVMGHHNFTRTILLAIVLGFIGQSSVQAQYTSYSTNFNTFLDGASILSGTDWSTSNNASAKVSTNIYSACGYPNSYSNAVVFLGTISNSFSLLSPDAKSNMVSAQLIVQVAVNDILPDPSTCPDRLGGICFSNNVANNSADVYCWTTNGWLKLVQTNGTAFNLASNTWALVTFMANFSGASTTWSPPSTNIVFYEVFINSTNVVPAAGASNRFRHGVSDPSFVKNDSGTYIESGATFTPAVAGIHGFCLSGSGSMNTLLATKGTPPIGLVTSPFQPGNQPLSAGIDIRAYQGADGVYVEFQTTAEEGAGQVTLKIRDANGNLIFVDSQPAVGSGNNTYLFLVPSSYGLVVGQPYNFTVIDEAGKAWSSPGVTVTSFAADLLQMSPMGVTMSFSTIPGKLYTIQWAQDLMAPSWQSVTNITAVDSHSSVFVFFPDPAALSSYFRILQN